MQPLAQAHKRQTTNPELTLIAALRAIVIEAIPDTPGERVSTESYLPGEFIAHAQAALAIYGAEVKPGPTLACPLEKPRPAATW